MDKIKSKLSFFVCVFFTLLSICQTSFADTYYLSSSIGNDKNDGLTTSTAWKTIKKVNNSHLNPGDKVLFARGEIWKEELIVTTSGVEGNPIVFGAYGNGDNPIIDGGFVRATSIFIKRKDYIIITDIQCLNWLSRGIHAVNANNIIVMGCTFLGGDGIAPDHGVQFQTMGWNLVTGIQITRNIFKAIGTSENDSVFFNGILVQGVNGAIISRNTLNTINTCGIRLILSGTNDNINCIIEENDIFGSYGGILVHNSDYTKVRYNKIHDGKGLGIGVAYGSDNIEIYYNLIYNITRSSNLWNGIDINHNCQNGVVYNNTIFKVHRHCLMIDDETSSCNGWVLKNNIFDASQNEGSVRLSLGIRGITKYISDNNLFHSQGRKIASFGNFGTEDGVLYIFPEYQKISNQDYHSINANPEFLSIENNNFRLKNLSPANGSAIDVGLTRDYNGLTLPKNGPLCIGAFQKKILLQPQKRWE